MIETGTYIPGLQFEQEISMFNPLNELTGITHLNFAESDAPEICVHWLDSLSSHMQVKKVDYKPEMKRTEVPLYNEESDSPYEIYDMDRSQSPDAQERDMGCKPALKEVPLCKKKSDSPNEIYDMDRSQSPDAQEKDMGREPALKEVSLCKKKSDSPDETDGNQSFTYEKKHKNKIQKPNYKHLDLQCGWLDCNYRSSNLDHFVHHVSLHIPHLEVKETQNHEGTNNVMFPRFLVASNT
jgi:hypothetical protein